MARREDACCMIIRCCILLCSCCPLHYSLPAPNTTATCHRPHSAHILQETLQEEDHKYDVKLLPADRQVSAFLQRGQTQRLVFPLVQCGPITITVTPCDFPVSWTLTLRSHHGGEERDSQPPPGGGNKNLIALVSAVGGHSSSHQHHCRRHNTITNVSYNSVKPLRRERRNESSAFRVWQPQEAAVQPNDTTASPGRKGEGIERREVKEEQVEVKQLHEAVEEQYEGHEPRQFTRQQAPAGLYVLQLHAARGATHVHILVTCLWSPPPTTARVTVTPTSSGRSITLHWAGSRSSGGYCLAASEGRPFPSLCAARAALAHARKANKWPRAILGCTDKPWYELPHAPLRALHVAVWKMGHAGPPLYTGLVPAKRKSRIPRLRPGALLRLVPSTTGTAVAKFRVRQRGRRLHVIAVACGAKLRLKVMVPRGERLASAVGNLGALHLAVKKRQTLPNVLFMRLVTWPTGAASEVILTASYTARALSLPRLPRNARVRVKGITCTSVTVRWSAARGSHSYCLLVKEDKSDKMWRTRPPRQCGWEAALKETNFTVKWCSPLRTAGRQEKVVDTLTSATTYIATVLSRHPVTGRALSFTPVRFTTPFHCLDATNTTVIAPNNQ